MAQLTIHWLGQVSMKKAVVSNRIYLNCEQGSELDEKLVKELTYEIDQQPVSEYPLIIRNMSRIGEGAMSIPSGRLDLIPEDYEFVDKRCYASAYIPEPSFVPRPSQQEAIDLLNDNGLVEAPVGFGKSIIGLGIAHNLQVKTLVVCTTTTIRDMWAGEVKKWFGIEPGIIGGGKYNLDSPIVISNIQTLRNKANKLTQEFGLVIVDEVHRSPAKTFTDTLNLLKARYKVGLSGTMVRKDGLHCVLQDYFGTRKFVGRVENTMEPTIHLWDVPVELNANEFIPWANKITQLIANEVYRESVVNLAKSYAGEGHSVLVVCDRTELLEYGHMETKEASLIITGKVTGGSIRQDIMDCISRREARILWATQSIFSEGVSLNELSCVILATPINNEPLLKQIIGRIQRQAEGKLEPVVVDIGLQGNTGRRHRTSRKGTYISEGWNMVDKNE